MSSIFDRVLDAFKLIGFQPNFKHNSLRAFAGHPKCHQGHQHQSVTSKSSSTSGSSVKDTDLLDPGFLAGSGSGVTGRNDPLAEVSPGAELPRTKCPQGGIAQDKMSPGESLSQANISPLGQSVPPANYVIQSKLPRIFFPPFQKCLGQNVPP